jgi:TRAP-type mannitol/chloroaromatic compound transport system permease small subunit
VGPGDQPAAGLAARGWVAAVAGLNSIGTAWIFALMALINVDVFSRYLFNAPIQGVTELVELSIVGIVFLQISDAIRLGRLTRSDGLYSRLASRHPAVAHVVGAVFELAGCLFFLCILAGGIPRLVEAYERGYFAGNEGLFVVPVWPIRAILVVGCLAASVQFLVLAWRHVSSLRRGDEAPR